MNNLNDLLLQRESLRNSLTEIQEKIDVFELKKFTESTEFKIGDRVTRYNDKFEVTSYKKQFGSFRLFGRKILKSGELGKETFELYGKLKKLEA